MERRLIAEWLGTFSLLATVIGSGVMAERLANGNVAIALLGNTIPTGAILVVLITIFGPISGAHFNPAVTLTFAMRGEIKRWDAALSIISQIFGGVVVSTNRCASTPKRLPGSRRQILRLSLPFNSLPRF